MTSGIACGASTCDGYAPELSVAIAAARKAGAAVMALFRSAWARTKPDGSYVTEADYAAERIVREAIGRAFPADAILSEEGVDDRRRLAAERCWLVDPIDGTEAFVRGTEDFDIYIALVVAGRPVVAATLQPATGLMLTATERGGASIWRACRPSEPLRLRPPRESPRLGTRPWLGAPGNLPLLEEAARAIRPHARVLLPDDGLGSRSLLPPDNAVDAIVGLAVDGADLDAWEWDLAPVDLIVREAGGCCTDLSGERLRFNRPNPRLSGVVLSTDQDTHGLILRALDAAMHDGSSTW